MLPNPEDERKRLLKQALLLTLFALYLVVTIRLWHYVIYG